MVRDEKKMSQNEIRRSLEDWFRLQLRLVWIREKKFPKGYRVKVQPRIPYRVWQILSGSAEIFLEDKTFRAGTGDFLSLPPGLTENRLTPGTRILSLAFDLHDPDMGLRLSSVRRIKGPKPALSKPLIALKRWSHRHSAAPDFTGPAAFGEQQSYLLQILEEILKEQPHPLAGPVAKPNARLQRVFHLLRQYDLQSFPPRQAIEVAAGVGGRRLEQLFREHYGATPREVHASLRLRRAKEKLLESDAGMAEIAENLGFADASTFSQFFKKQTGLSPGRFQQSGSAEHF